MMRSRFGIIRFAIVIAAAIAFASAANAADTLNPPHWQSQGIFGSYDIAALQRGFLVYQSNCAACHSMNALHYRDLQSIGLSPEQAAAIASNVKLTAGPATLDDIFKDPHPDITAFGGAIPPDLSNILDARPGGLNYIFGLLTDYAAVPADITLLPNHYFNTAYPGNQIAMPPPLKDNQVTYADETKSTAIQEASDVTAFLAWASQPNLNIQHAIGLRAVLFLIFLAILAIATKRKIWRETV
jgi:ubiquinol-cytochrome c reductase cytochrome c1 subunit